MGGLRAHLNPGIPYFEIDSLMTSAKTLFPSQVSFPGSRAVYLLGGVGCHLGFPGRSAVKNLPAMPEMQETWIQSLGWEDPLEESIATHSSILARKIQRTEEPGGLQSIGSQRVRHN